MRYRFEIIIDTETTVEVDKTQFVADFGAVVANLATGEILDELGVLISGQFDRLDLWCDVRAPAGDFWSLQNERVRRKRYLQRIADGSRSIASNALVNIWLAKNAGKYDPIATAYNWQYDHPKCDNTGIHLSAFRRNYCLLKAARDELTRDADYVAWCQERGHMTRHKTPRPQMNADCVARYFVGDDLPPEPHTALEDARDYELAIASALYRRGALPYMG